MRYGVRYATLVRVERIYELSRGQQRQGRSGLRMCWSVCVVLAEFVSSGHAAAWRHRDTHVRTGVQACRRHKDHCANLRNSRPELGARRLPTCVESNHQRTRMPTDKVSQAKYGIFDFTYGHWEVETDLEKSMKWIYRDCPFICVESYSLTWISNILCHAVPIKIRIVIPVDTFL